jgi:REP element-mobilizing transposase RayT
MVEQEWLILTQRFPGIKLHEYIIMPNHFHGIIETVGAPLVGAQSRDPEPAFFQNQSKGTPNMPSKHIGQIIGAFKSYTTNAYIKGVKTQNWPEFEKRLWQRNYWEHIIRTPEAYQNISNYIIHNPETWQTDSLQSEIPKAA